MTASTEQAAGAELNGQAAGAGEAGAEPGGLVAATAGERLMGLIGIAFAAGLLAIGLDLLTGGAVSRMITGDGEADGGAGG